MQKYKQTKSQMKERERKSFCSSYKMMQINRLIPSLKICALNRTFYRKVVICIKYLVWFGFHTFSAFLITLILNMLQIC